MAQLLLIADQDQNLVRPLAGELAADGYAVISATATATAIEAAESMACKLDGSACCGKARTGSP